MKLEKHERKRVLKLLQMETLKSGKTNVSVWGMGILGVLSIANNSIGNPNAVDDLFHGIGLVFLMAALGMWEGLQQTQLIQKLAKRLDDLDPNWTIPDE